ncbi:NUDIX hydrolase [Gilvibacter sp.]|uniref:NUDIX hydrolase n=1 Tax=Gilvibacter sp. TaxID=2729997 RepID=UPI0025C73DFC|nr:NUDIX hydrolase [Gilvibacter sp.]NQX77108.1 NUDIX hydrolase [Gilvibacter sp.]
MKFDYKDLLENCIPGLSIDCVVFGYKDKKLHVLLVRFIDSHVWALPGGFIPKDQDMDAVANQVLLQRTGLKEVFLQQSHVFSSLNRHFDINPRSRLVMDTIKSTWMEEQKEELEAWFSQRFISTSYMALVDAEKVHPQIDVLSDACDWIPLDELPELIIDHSEMIHQAHEQLRMKIRLLPIGKSLLPERFTMSDLQSLYEAILDQKLDRGNFQRKMIRLGFLNRQEKLMTGAQNKAPYLYSINDEAYNELLEKGIGFS